MRHIKEIKNLPISELTDEEIVKAAMYRLNASMAVLCYRNMTGMECVMLGHYKNGAGRSYYNMLIKAWERCFGKVKRLDYPEE